jgi:membrane protein YqaA with SNARE-associated domain
LSWARHRHAPVYLTGLSFVEAIIFPVMPEVMLAPMCVAKPKSGFWFATLSLAGSMAGAMVGYALGHYAFEALKPLFAALGMLHGIESGNRRRAGKDGRVAVAVFMFLVLGGFMPIPMKVFTWARASSACPLLHTSEHAHRARQAGLSSRRGNPHRRRARGADVATLHRADRLDCDGVAGCAGGLGDLEGPTGRMTNIRRIAFLALATVAMAACTSTVVRRTSTSPVAPRVSTPKYGASAQVQRGDTLYGIAFRNGIDVRDLAAWNGISAPYTIYPARACACIHATVLRRRQSGLAPTRRGRRPPAAPSRPTAGTAKPVRPVDDVTRCRHAGVATSRCASERHQLALARRGRAAQPFRRGEPTKQGIDITGEGGAPVTAAADGVVVYSGSGLVGYGELIIIKHNDAWLSGLRPQPGSHGQRRRDRQGGPTSRGDGPHRRRDMSFRDRTTARPVDPPDVPAQTLYDN